MQKKVEKLSIVRQFLYNIILFPYTLGSRDEY